MEGHFVELGRLGRGGGRALAALSGGVDSAVAALLLCREGLKPVGITIKNFCYADWDLDNRSCCSLGSIEDARGVCERLGIPHRVIDAEELFAREVIANFVSEYRSARTPNPCVRCNSIVRFRSLTDYARRLGVGYVCTGHYARVFLARGGIYYLARAKDSSKDQSYFLSSLHGSILGRVLFPVGNYSKKTVRGLAREAALPVACKEESQEVCFIPDGDLRGFLSGKISSSPGRIENTKGEVIGEHDGLFSYTIGQRRGLGISYKSPKYVVKIDKERNVLVLGDEEDLYCKALACTMVWLDEAAADPHDGIAAQIRSRHEAAEVRRLEIDGKRCRVEFVEPQKAICPGQTIAFYRGDLVVGSGVIDEAAA